MAFGSVGFALNVDTSKIIALSRDVALVDNQVAPDLAQVLGTEMGRGVRFMKSIVPTFRRDLQGSIHATSPTVRVSGNAIIFEAGIQTGAMPQAIVMDQGRTPGAAMPSISRIEEWVSVKALRGGLDLPQTKKGTVFPKSGRGRAPGALPKKRFKPGERKRAVKRLAFIVARSIMKRGITAHKYVEKTENFVFRNLVTSIGNKVAEWERRLEGGGS